MESKRKTKEQLLSLIEIEKVYSRELELKCWDKLLYSNPHDREIKRLQILLLFTDLGVDYEEGSTGFITIKRKEKGNIIYALRTGRWKVEGKKVWYRSGKLSIKEFVEKYVEQ